MILKGKTHKGRSRVKELGKFWDTVTTAERVMFSVEVGPWLLVRPRFVPGPRHDRWVHPKHDRDFEVCEE